jgi:glycosyltransferase involved in cell wall biosynthesis/SAM-dependent methyltransferase
MMNKPMGIADFYNGVASARREWRRKNAYYYEYLADLHRFLIPPGRRVLELGSGTGELLAAVNPAQGTGVDIAGGMVAVAAEHYADSENLAFVEADAAQFKTDEPYDYVIMSDLVGDLEDVWQCFRNARGLVHQDGQIVVSYFNALWEPILNLGEAMGWKMPQQNQNWLGLADIRNLLELNGFEVVKQGQGMLFPKKIPFISELLNRFVARLPLIQHLCLSVHLVARPLEIAAAPSPLPSVTVLIPCRNEKGNIRAAVERTPDMGSHTEILFVDGNSNDGTAEEIEAVIEEYSGKRDIKLLHQVAPGSADGAGHGKMLKLGKGDAVRKGFQAAEGDMLMILDADLTVLPEELPMFYHAMVENRGQFINGTRLVYPMEEDAMRFLNKIANRFFGLLFSWLLDQRIKDTLCGTKVLYKRDYLRIADNRSYFGDFDPFGDFDLLFGASKLSLKIVEVPVHYAERTYGEIKIERFKHGLLLIKMSFVAFMKLKFRL